MNLVVCKDYREMSQKAAAMAAESICAADERLISFPGGDTPLGMVNAFVALVNDGIVDISRTRYVQLDEWVGLGEKDKGACAEFNRQNLIDKLTFPFLEFFLINGLADDIQYEGIGVIEMDKPHASADEAFEAAKRNLFFLRKIGMVS